MNTHVPQTSYPFLPSPRSYLTLPSPPPLPSSILSPPLPSSLSMSDFHSHRMLDCQPHHHHRSFFSIDRPSSSSPPLALPSAPQQKEEDSDSLLIRTASVLALSALEQKGHSWLAARKSSTSLSLSVPISPTVSGAEYFSSTAIHPYACSHRSFAVSTDRAARSKHHSRRTSTSNSAPTPYLAADFVLRETMLQHEPSLGLKDGTYSSAATAVAESEVRRLLMARVGGWLEWAVGWMDFRDDDDEDDFEDEDVSNDGFLSATATALHNPDNQNRQGITEMSIREVETAQPNPATASTISRNGPDGENADQTESRNGVLADRGAASPSPPPPPPPPPSSSSSWTGGVPDIWWGDAKWLFAVAGRVAW